MTRLYLEHKELVYIQDLLCTAVKSGISPRVRNGSMEWPEDLRTLLSLQEKLDEAFIEYETEPTSN